MPEPKSDTKRPLGFWSATAAVIATMIGAGIFGATGGFAHELGTASNVLLVWLFCGLLALTGALSLGELGAMLPRSGGCYAYNRHLYGETAGYLSGILSWLLAFVGAAAYVTLLLGHHVQQLVPELSPAISASITVIIFSGIHCTGLREGTWVNNAFTVIKIGVIGSFIVAGFVAAPKVIAMARVDDPGIFSSEFAAAMISVSFAYLGWETTTWIGGEVRNPNRNLPLSLIIGTLFVMSLYLLLNAVYLRADAPAAMNGADNNATVANIENRRLIYQPQNKQELHWIQFAANHTYTNIVEHHGSYTVKGSIIELAPEKPNSSATPLTIVFSKTNISSGDPMTGTYAPKATVDRVVIPGSDIKIGLHTSERLFSGNVALWFNLMIIVVLISTTSTIIMVGSHILLAMSRDGQLPPGFGLLNHRAVPANALAVQAVAMLVFIWFANSSDRADNILIFIGLPTTIIVAAAVFGVIILRRRDPKRDRPFRVPLYPLTPLLFIALATWMVGSTVKYKWEASIASAALVVAVWGLKKALAWDNKPFLEMNHKP